MALDKLSMLLEEPKEVQAEFDFKPNGYSMGATVSSTPIQPNTNNLDVSDITEIDPIDRENEDIDEIFLQELFSSVIDENAPLYAIFILYGHLILEELRDMSLLDIRRIADAIIDRKRNYNVT